MATVDAAYRPPAAALARFVSGYHWYGVTTAPGEVLDDVFYPGWANLRFQASGSDWALRIGTRAFDPVPRAAVFGPTSCAAYARSHGGTLFGVGITPLGWTRLTNLQAADFADRVRPIDTLLGAAGEQLAVAISAAPDLDAAARIFDTFFAVRMLGPRSIDPRIEATHALLADAPPISIEEAADRLGISRRSFNRFCRRAFGFGPKLLLRRARFLRTLIGMRDAGAKSWSGQLDPAYHDHSHFVRDAHEFLGMAPGAFLRLPKPLNDLSTRLRAQQLGAPAQALHQPA